jgi:hypothetical protein
MDRALVVDFMAGEQHHADHTWPIYTALPTEMRGAFITRPWHRDPEPMERSDRAGYGDLVLAPSWGDLARARSTRRPVIFTEHGAGFRFNSSSYCGHPDRPNVALFLCQNEWVAKANRETHPYTESVVVGVPKMDEWYARPQKVRGDRPVVAIAFHWDCRVAPGAHSGWHFYKPFLPQLKATAEREGWDLVAHSHPRIAQRVKLECQAQGIPFWDRLEDVFANADMLIADATSAAYEFASLDRPVLNLSIPLYKQEPIEWIRHPWFVPGLEIWDGDDLSEAAIRALADPREAREARHEAVEQVYPIRGDASARAARAIQEFIECC